MPARMLPAAALACLALLAPPAQASRPALPHRVENERFVVHHAAGDEARAQRVLAFMTDRVRPTFLDLGFALPPRDTREALEAAHFGRAADEADASGDGRYDIYIDPAELYPGVNYGPYFILRPDAADADAIGTAAHEYFHSVQTFTHHSSGRGSWMVESTAHWASDLLSSDPGGPAVVSRPTQGLFCGLGPGCPFDEGPAAFYAPFAEYLQARFGPTTIARVFDRMRFIDPPPWGGLYNTDDHRRVARAALTQEIEAHGQTVGRIVADWAVASLFPAYGHFGRWPAEHPQDVDNSFSGRLATDDVLDLRTSAAAPVRQTATPALAVAPLAARFVVLRNEAPDAVTVTVERSEGAVVAVKALTTADGAVRDAAGGGAGSPVTFTVPGAAAGRRLVHLVVANPTDAALSFRLSASARRPAGPPPPPPDRTRPVLRSLGFSPAVLVLGRRVRARFALSEAARVVLEFRRGVPGRREGRRCVLPTRRNRRAPACIRYVTVGTLGLDLPAGVTARSFDGGLRRRRLAPGPYLVKATPTDAAGNVGRGVTVRLTVRDRR